MWLPGREILVTVQDEQLGSHFRGRSWAEKLWELQVTGQARVWHVPVTGAFLRLGFEETGLISQ